MLLAEHLTMLPAIWDTKRSIKNMAISSDIVFLIFKILLEENRVDEDT